MTGPMGGGLPIFVDVLKYPLLLLYSCGPNVIVGVPAALYNASNHPSDAKKWAVSAVPSSRFPL